uniref:uncharacterized protein n=1 Tax=Pristiophorus japonicus TaxID=55135 RepID=UPI00398E7F10
MLDGLEKFDFEEGLEMLGLFPSEQRKLSSGGWKIPETEVPEQHCSTVKPGWINGTHPTVGQGEVTRTVCFNYDGNRCNRTLEIKIKNCTSYSVYELKPPPDCNMTYCTVADSVLTDPCVDHTILDQPWRSTDCGETGCIANTQCDQDLDHGWYRFKSSGGWKIPETAVPDYHCSTRAPGWLKGTHPTVGQGEVTGTVCFTWFGSPCYYTREIKIKNCTSYSVYKLNPTHCYAAYCTVPETTSTQGPKKQSTVESTDHRPISQRCLQPQPRDISNSGARGTIDSSTHCPPIHDPSRIYSLRSRDSRNSGA